MPGETAFRRAAFQEGTRIRMADGQDWWFPNLPEAGVDAQYDALMDARLDAEDRDEVLRVELAIAILLLSRNYILAPADYMRILDFGDDLGGLQAARSAISDLIGTCGRRSLTGRATEEPDPSRRSGRMGQLNSLLASWGIRLKAGFWT